MVVESSLARSFNLHIANNVPEDRYLSIRPTGYAVVGSFDKGIQDVTGQEIQLGKEYRCIVLSMAGGEASINQLSAYSDIWNIPIKKEPRSRRPAYSPIPFYGTADSPSTNEAPPRQYPKVKPNDVRLYGARKEIVFKTTVSELDPNSRINVYNAEGKLVAGRAINEREFKFDLSDQPEGIYSVKLNLNNTLISRGIYIR